MASDHTLTEERRTRDDALSAELRANGGRTRDGGDRLVILTTTGRKSGRPHAKPMCVQPDGDDLIVAGTAGGQPTHTQWYLNLSANPEVTVEYLGETYQATASTVLNGPDRDRLYQLMVEVIPGANGYQDRCRDQRQIPIVRLERT